MPMYDFKCGACGHADDEYRKMDSDPTQECPKCGALAYVKQVSLPHTLMQEFHTPIDLYSIAMEDPAQIRAFKQAAPDVQCSDNPEDPAYGVPIAASRHQKLQALKAAGFEERT
jgi:putative FmdB family regulatory protein